MEPGRGKALISVFMRQACPRTWWSHLQKASRHYTANKCVVQIKTTCRTDKQCRIYYTCRTDKQRQPCRNDKPCGHRTETSLPISGLEEQLLNLAIAVLLEYRTLRGDVGLLHLLVEVECHAVGQLLFEFTETISRSTVVVKA